MQPLLQAFNSACHFQVEMIYFLSALQGVAVIFVLIDVFQELRPHYSGMICINIVVS